MKKLITSAMCIAFIITMLIPVEAIAQRRRVVVRARPHRTTIVVRLGTPSAGCCLQQ